MHDTVGKIKLVMAVNRTTVKDMSEEQLVDFLWEHDCVRDRVMNKADILHFLKQVGK